MRKWSLANHNLKPAIIQPGHSLIRLFGFVGFTPRQRYMLHRRVSLFDESFAQVQIYASRANRTRANSPSCFHSSFEYSLSIRYLAFEIFFHFSPT